MSLWLATIQSACQSGDVSSAASSIGAIRANVQLSAPEVEGALALRLVEVARDPTSQYVYFEAKVNDPEAPPLSPERWQQRAAPYRGSCIQPLVVRYSWSHPRDSMDIVASSFPDASSFWVRAVRTGENVDTPVPPGSPGQRWFAFSEHR
jgi:hypothetical protein